MFKNLLGKAKSAIEDIDISLKNGNNSKPKKMMEYDSNYFTFTLEGGPLHTSTINAVAKIKSGEKAGEPIPIACHWFISTIDGRMVEIEGLTGSTYQPCAEDVGSRITVQVTPEIIDGKYIGMPVYGEVGPLVLDKTVEDKVIAFLDAPVSDYKIKIEKMSFDIENKPETFPCEGFVSLNKQQKMIEVYSANGEEKAVKLAFCEHSDQHPCIEFVRNSEASFELQINDTRTFRILAESSIDRDILATALRMFGNEDLQNEESEEKEKTSKEIKQRKRTTSSNLQILMKREKLIKQVKQLEKDNADIKKEMETKENINIKLETELNGMINKMREKEASILQLQEEVLKMKNERENLLNEKLFLSQEVNLYKCQNVELEATIKSIESHSNKSKDSIEKELNPEETEETIKILKAKLAKAELDFEQLQKEKELQYNRICALENESETKEANINALKKKVQSLVQENERKNNFKLISKDFDLKCLPVPPLAKSVSHNEIQGGLSCSPKKKIFEPIIDSFQTHIYEDEIRQLKQSNEKLTATVEWLRSNQDSPSRRNKNGGFLDFSIKENTETLECLQKLVNNLTEVISEKDVLLENQKRMNKELAKKVTELEQGRNLGKSI